MAQEKGTGSVEATAKEGKVIPANEAWIKFLTHMEDLATLDAASGGTGIDGSQVLAILGAATEAEMWEADNLPRIGGRDIADVEMKLDDFTVKFGEIPDPDDPDAINTIFVGPRTGKQMYLLIPAVRLSPGPRHTIPHIGVGQEFNWNTSAPLIVAKMFWLRQNGKLPGQMAVIRETPIKGGKQKVIKLEELAERPVQAATA